MYDVRFEFRFKSFEPVEKRIKIYFGLRTRESVYRRSINLFVLGEVGRITLGKDDAIDLRIECLYGLINGRFDAADIWLIYRRDE